MNLYTLYTQARTHESQTDVYYKNKHLKTAQQALKVQTKQMEAWLQFQFCALF